jgi:Ca2+-transporting ATPase
MTTVHKFPASEGEIPPEYSDVWNWSGYVGEFPYIVFSKGAVDSLLEISDKVWVEDRVEELNDSWRQRIVDANEEQARNGMRVLGVATRTLDKIPDKVEQKELEVGLIFIGMVSMIDPARPEVKDSIRTCKTAGIRPVMITGDHPLTAEKIANELGISSSEGILTGQDLSNIPLTELNNIVNKVNVFARVSPEHKLNIVTAMQNNGQIVAMTGDGVNDAPALNKADIGVAMGITGTDVAKEAADIVLLDDNFATIVAAVEEGRRIYDNIRKFFKFLMASNAGEIWVMIIAPLIGMPFPLLPLQILWINLVTDGFPGLALGVEPAEKDIMRRPPYPPNESIFARGVARQIIWVGIFMGLVSLGIGYAYWSIGHPDWQTMVFTTLTLSQMGNALAFRSEKDSIFKIGLLSNKSMVQAISLTLVLQLFVLYIPFLQRIFNTTPLSPIDLFVCVIASLAVLLGVEIDKWISRMREKREQKELIA